MSSGSQVPDAGTPIFDSRGYIDPVWHQFFFTLLRRTGGTIGVDAQDQLERINLLNLQASDNQGLDSSMAAIGQELPDDAYALSRAWSHGAQYDPDHHAVATEQENGFMSAVDKVKLGQVRTTIAPAVMIVPVTTTNTTADADILSLIVPAGKAVAGTTLRGTLYGRLANAASSGNIQFWVRLGSTKILTLTISAPSAALTLVGTLFTFDLTFRSGTSLAIAGSLSSSFSTYGSSPAISTDTASVDASVSNTITIGWNWTVANSSNIALAQTCIITQEA